ncbi:uncharacterized protein ACA1_022070 [Acanthamoeba castellanii str. Neff]|uniref:Uncharacterized protein n=1 Tax=Acanthamoeba castellanii (strain ATCC 30010 / Neff) TaxID=1257118 RepID=L8GD87_ACACF|nr:uncharacterized protein ACA1_022070 [Acanthamoeba castellanii str. Neff]ELR10829.1 hypothetical protein ACA1_022070 [Acanthamoeba castellanii str. Neff]
MDRMTAGVVAVPLASLPLNAKALLEDYPEVAAWLSKNGLSLTLTNKTLNRAKRWEERERPILLMGITWSVCRFSRVSHALWAATDNSTVLIEEGSYSEDLDSAFSSAVRIIANNVTLLAQGQVVLQGSGGDQWLVVAAPLFTIDGSLTLVDRGISISEGSTLVQKGSLHISVTAALRSGIKVDAGATWIQEGSVTITSGSLAEAQISLSNGIHLESTGEWHQYGELTLFSHGSDLSTEEHARRVFNAGVLAYGLWNQTGPATLTVVGEIDRRPGHHKGVFGEGVRLVGQATWNQWGPLSISAINASTVVYVSYNSLWLQYDSAVMTLDSPIGVLTSSASGTSQWVQNGALDITLSGSKAIGTSLALAAETYPLPPQAPHVPHHRALSV